MNLFTPDNKLGETGLVDKVQLIHTLILFVVLLLVDWLLPIYFSAPLQVAPSCTASATGKYEETPI